jgi:hypothetical protein
MAELIFPLVIPPSKSGSRLLSQTFVRCRPGLGRRREALEAKDNDKVRVSLSGLITYSRYNHNAIHGRPTRRWDDLQQSSCIRMAYVATSQELGRTLSRSTELIYPKNSVDEAEAMHKAAQYHGSACSYFLNPPSPLRAILQRQQYDSGHRQARHTPGNARAAWAYRTLRWQTTLC